MSHMQKRIVRGDVVTCAHASGVVWAVLRHRLVVLPIIPKAETQRANDVLVEELADQIALGCGGLDVAIRPADARMVASAGQTRTGWLLPRLMERVWTAAAREIEDQAIYDRWRTAARLKEWDSSAEDRAPRCRVGK